VRSSTEALRATTTPLVGRDEENDLLMRRWQHAKDGDGSVVLLAGEPGIGKSRIIQAILERLEDEPRACAISARPTTMTVSFIRSLPNSNEWPDFGATIAPNNG